jgi:hypothetical protein
MVLKAVSSKPFFGLAAGDPFRRQQRKVAYNMR